MLTGGFFICGTFHLWWAGVVSLGLGVGTILYWLWTGTAVIPEKASKPAGLGLTLPLYASGPASVGWWAMFITMLGDITAFTCLVFGYFFFWTSNSDFPPVPSPGPDAFWTALAGVLLATAWALTLASREFNKRDRAHGFYAALLAGMAAAIAGGAALLAAPLVSGMSPSVSAYNATVWALVVWTLTHVLAGLIMQGYSLARRLAGRMTAVHDIDISTICVFWHFLAITALVTVAVIGGFPLVAGGAP
jgi:cytochrome c oxidase subunit I+III